MEAMSGYELNLRCTSCLCSLPYNTQVCQRREILPYKILYLTVTKTFFLWSFLQIYSRAIKAIFNCVLGLANPLRRR